MPYAYKIFLMPKIRADISNGLILNPGMRLWAKTLMLSVVFLKRSLETITDKHANKCRNTEMCFAYVLCLTVPMLMFLHLGMLLRCKTITSHATYMEREC